MRDHKKEDREYLDQFKDKSVNELMDILSAQADDLKNFIKDMFNKENKDGKD
jgi:ligand-binding sensor protein